MKHTTLHPNIVPLVPLLEGVVKLLHPYAEGAIHDLRQGKIVALYNTISKRKVGDSSPVTELGIDVKDFPDVFDPYYKTNWDGRQLKCTSVTIRDDAGEPIGLICLNFDTSVFQNMTVQLDKFLSLASAESLNPIEQFGENWQQQVLAFIEVFARKHDVAVSALSKEQKAELVCEMYDHAFFNYRDAAAYVARQLGVSRTTIYNYLKRGQE
jgi:predicted transcriptional regulator YheO